MQGLIPRSWAPPLLSLLRIVTGFLFVAHGTQKLFGFPIESQGGPIDLASRAGVAGVIEVVGGTLLILGLLTRLMAFVMSGEMAFAYFLVHAPRGFWPLVNTGELAALYCFLFLYFAAAGAGPYSLDAWIALHRARSRPDAYGLPYPRRA